MCVATGEPGRRMRREREDQSLHRASQWSASLNFVMTIRPIQCDDSIYLEIEYTIHCAELEHFSFQPQWQIIKKYVFIC